MLEPVIGRRGSEVSLMQWSLTPGSCVGRHRPGARESGGAQPKVVIVTARLRRLARWVLSAAEDLALLSFELRLGEDATCLELA